MNIVRGLKRVWLVAAIVWAVFVPLYIASDIADGAQSTYRLASASAEHACRQMRNAPSDCFSTEYDKNVAQYGESFVKRFGRLFLDDGLWPAIGWLLVLLAIIILPAAIVYGIGAIVVWIGRGFKAS
jgi:hypothetical protein